MRIKFFLLIALFAAVKNTSGQISDSASRQTNYQYYQNKAKNQSRAALALFGVGLVVATYSAIEVVNNLFNDKGETAAIGLLVGGGMELGGLALAFASSRNRKKAKQLQVSAGMQSGSFLNGLSLQKVYYPSLSLKIHL